MRRKRAVAVSVQLAESEDPQPALGVRNAFRLCRSADQSHIKRPCEIILLFKCYATLCCHWGDFCTYSSVKTLDTVVSFKLLFLFFLKCLCDPSEWQYERSAVLHVLHFHETFDVILFSEFSFSSLHKLSSQRQINMARRQVSKPTGNVHNQMFLAKLLFSLHSPGGFLCTNSWHFPKNDICKIRPCECERFKWTRPEESDRKRRPHKKTDGLGYAISLTTGQQKSSHALDKGA